MVGALAAASHDSSWITVLGAALSGLGATVNGLNSLYGVSSQFSSALPSGTTAMAGTLVSGTMAVTSGLLAAAKGTAGAAASGVAAGGPLSLTTLSLGAGCIYASCGLVYFVHSLMRTSTASPPAHAPLPGSPEANEFPQPDWLSTKVLNWAIMGRVGVGKSTLINALRGLTARSPEAAPVGVGHTTRRPKVYSFTGDVAVLTANMARLWDLPGAGTKDWPSATYIRDAGLRHFDGVVLVTCGAFSDSEVELLSQLVDFKVPYYIVRNKVDQDVVNNLQDNGTDVKETLDEIRSELLENGCDATRSFLISAKEPSCPDYDFAALLRHMAADVMEQRAALPEFQVNEAIATGLSSLRERLLALGGGEAPTRLQLPSQPAGGRGFEQERGYGGSSSSACPGPFRAGRSLSPSFHPPTAERQGLVPGAPFSQRFTRSLTSGDLPTHESAASCRVRSNSLSIPFQAADGGGTSRRARLPNDENLGASGNGFHPRLELPSMGVPSLRAPMQHSVQQLGTLADEHARRVQQERLWCPSVSSHLRERRLLHEPQVVS